MKAQTQTTAITITLEATAATSSWMVKTTAMQATMTNQTATTQEVSAAELI